MYQLDITLKRGQNLAARDRGALLPGQIRSAGCFCDSAPSTDLLPGLLFWPLWIWLLQLSSQDRPTDINLPLKDPHYPDHDLGTILLSVLLAPKEEQREVFQPQSLRLSDMHRKSQLWRGIVSITLIEGCELKAMDANGLSDPYVKFRLGHQKYKSKIVPKTLNPQWREQFDFHLYEERGGIIDITVWDKDAGKRDDFIGRCEVDLSALSREQTHKLELQLEEGEGWLVLLVTLTASAAVSISDLSVNSLEDQKEREEILKRYSTMRMFHNMKDVGFLQVKVIRAEALMAADVTGSKSDPFCVVELNNDRLLTHTVYKNLNPEWNKVFTFNIKDIHSVLEVTVYDEDRDRSADFLGKVAIPLLSIQNGEQKAYVLKNKQLTGPTKGVIYLEIDVIFNAVKASIRTLMPKEQKYIEEENRLSKQLLLRNFIRMKRCVMVLINAAYYVNSCFDWDSPQRSLAAFVLCVCVAVKVNVKDAMINSSPQNGCTHLILAEIGPAVSSTEHFGIGVKCSSGTMLFWKLFTISGAEEETQKAVYQQRVLAGAPKGQAGGKQCNEAIAGPSSLLLQDNFRAHQDLLKRIAVNLVLKEITQPY
ncbi:Multiple C2 and transmembrane domain-containing protein 1 [Chelonia mydas]|uniref:Multiple C2 and transmembrane domain-containing protein 1 n=1 Tax=Chelonia mydas TaxID=8469 RepID=M7BZ68_CHEMY|nr:Multiple C2 and transmembrane domain-containing protein 1 [Chelonia mydas]